MSDDNQTPWIVAARDCGLSDKTLSVQIIEAACREYAEQHAAALTQENEQLERANSELQEQLDAVVNGVSAMAYVRDKQEREFAAAREALAKARSLIAEWLPAHAPMPPSKEEQVLAEIDAILGKEPVAAKEARVVSVGPGLTPAEAKAKFEEWQKERG